MRQLTLFAGERHVVPCVAGSAVAPKGFEFEAADGGIAIAAWRAGTGELAARCEGEETTLRLHAIALPDLFDGEDAGLLPTMPNELTFRMGEKRAFNPACEVRTLKGSGRAASAELTLTRVLIIAAEEPGDASVTFECAGGGAHIVAVHVR